MSDRREIEQLVNQLAGALARIGELESKIETMRLKVNANFNGHTDVLKLIYKESGCTFPVRFEYVDVAQI